VNAYLKAETIDCDPTPEGGKGEKAQAR